MSLLLVAAVAAGLAGPVDQGQVVVNRGAAGVTLGMTGAEVVARLGRPQFSTPAQLGYDGGFDAYLEHGRVAFISARGPGFCVGKLACLGGRDPVGPLLRRYGKALRPITIEDGSTYYELRGRYRGRAVRTLFGVRRHSATSAVLQAFIGWCDQPIGDIPACD